MSCNAITAALPRRGGIEEADDRVEQALGLVAMRRVAAVFELEDARPGNAPLDRSQLLERAVLIVATLHRKHGAADASDLRLDVPGAEPRIEPDVVPPPEGRIDVGMVLREPL